MKSLLYTVVSVGTMLFSCVAMGQTIPKDRAEWWRSNAPTCTAPDGFVFPSKKIGNEYDDGDINLFAGLLCADGEPIGCETVRRGQDASGRWFRSPRRAQTDNLGEKNSFSRDMALGALLYIATTGDVEALRDWGHILNVDSAEKPLHKKPGLTAVGYFFFTLLFFCCVVSYTDRPNV